MLPVKHRINLYLPRFRPPKFPREVFLFLITSFLTILGVLVVSIAGWLFNSYTAAQIEQLQVEQNQRTNELKELTDKLPSLHIDKNLEMRVQRERENVNRHNKIISFLNQDLINDRRSFTSLFEQLSQQQVNGIWLSKIEILNQGSDIQLYGFAKTPEKVSRYILALGEKSAYTGRSFKQINVTQGERAWNDFFLSTKRQETNQEQSTATNKVMGSFGL